MSKISQIELALKTISPDLFHKLCDVYLFYKCEISPISFGSVTGADKSKSGIPDSYLVLPNDQFIFIQYTTQQKDLKSKLISDIKECLDESKTEISVSKIKKVILCFNSTLSPPAYERVLKFGNNNNIKVNLIDLDTLKHEIFKYPPLAKQFLGIEMDTGQILKEREFVSELERLSTTQQNAFYSRKSEIDKTLELLKSNNLIIVSGKAGLGKSRLAREVISEYVNVHTEYEAFYLINSGQSIIHDLKSYFLPGRKYILLVDDINRMVDIPTIARLTIVNSPIVKIICTCRDYTRNFFLPVLENHKIEWREIKINKLGDDTITAILKEQKVTSRLCVDNILKIADGNPRLALMAAEFALKDDDCLKLTNIVEVYHKFFNRYLNEAKLEDENLIKVFGLISFFRIIDKNNEAFLSKLYTVFDIAPEVFWKYIQILHALGLIDLYHEDIVKISDQVLANYIFYHAFLEKKIVDLGQLINQYFWDYKEKFKESIYPLLENYGYQDIIGILSPTLTKYLSHTNLSEKKLIEFYGVFPFNNPTEIQLFILDQINKLDSPENEKYDLNMEAGQNKYMDIAYRKPLFDLITKFSHADEPDFKTHIDLIFKYAHKKHEDLTFIIQYLKIELCYELYDYNHYYKRQVYLFDYLFSKIDQNVQQNLYNQIFIEIAPTFLATNLEKSRPGRSKGKIEFYTLKVSNSQEIQKLRTNIIKTLSTLYTAYPRKVMNAFIKYVGAWEKKPNKELYSFDSTLWLVFINEHFSPENFKQTFWVHRYLEKLHNIDIKGVQLDELAVEYDTEIYRLFKSFHFGYSDWRELDKKGGNIEFLNFNKKRLFKLYGEYSLPQQKELYRNLTTIKESLSDEFNFYDIDESYRLILDNLFDKSPVDCLEIIMQILNDGNNIKITLYNLIKKLIGQFGAIDIYNLLTEKTYEKKPDWLIKFFTDLPKEEVNNYFYAELIEFYKSLHGQVFLFLPMLEKFKSINQKIYVHVFDLFLKKAEEDNFKLDYQAEKLFEDYFNEFAKDIEVLKKIYIYSLSQSRINLDDKGQYFRKIYDLDEGLLLDLIELLSGNTSFVNLDDIKFDLQFIWKLEYAEKIIIDVIDFTITRNIHHGSDHAISLFFPLKNHSERMEKFVAHYISDNYSDHPKMVIICKLICRNFQSKRIEFLKILRDHTTDLELWYSLPLPTSGYSGVFGSLIPIHKRIKAFWESLLPIFSGSAEYLKLRQWVLNQIEDLDRRIDEKKVGEFLEDY